MFIEVFCLESLDTSFSPWYLTGAVVLICFISVLALIMAHFALSGLIRDTELRPILKPGYYKKDKDEQDDNVCSNIVWIVLTNDVLLLDRYNSNGVKLRDMFANNNSVTEYVLIGHRAYHGIRINSSNIDANNRLMRRLNAGFTLAHPRLIANVKITSRELLLDFDPNSLQRIALLRRWF
jgi:hypothetical protein